MNLAKFALIAGLAVLSGCNQTSKQAADVPEPDYLRTHSLRQLMAGVIDPTADIYWDASGWIMDEHGTTDLSPKTDAEWNQVQVAAATLTELANLLMTEPYAKGRGRDWIDHARGLAIVGQKAEQAAKAHDPQQVMSVGATIDEVCSSCHDQFLTQDVVAAEAKDEESEASGEPPIAPGELYTGS